MRTVAMLGAGAWGTALAKLLATKREEVWLWAKEPEVVQDIEQNHENSRYLPGISLPLSVHATMDLKRALGQANLVVFSVPSHAIRGVLVDAARWLRPDVPLVSATKGIENASLMLIHEIVIDVLGKDRFPYFTCLSGPSFAREVALDHPTAVVAAGPDEAMVSVIQQRFASEAFRVYSSEDVIGVEIGGALKNVIAIAAGAVDSLGFGYNSRAALITRGLAEIARLAVAKGAQPLTIAGLAGLGDLVLTCTGELSRNRKVGFELGRGKALEQVLGELGHVAEGVKTTQSAYALARALEVPMPITQEVYCVLYEGKAPLQALGDLMGRALRPELDFR